ncbi:unnamed protein product [Rotaria sp. Silwood2]|nr:unnamed protein product [Rotaria sp. Silwood2]CAF2772568.1 unnamed protein product [Rotaria sp. Silwood2]CAF3151280.1 unnamed protein product [Rotaria sp. Silwood2]CAF3912997.1 unnamed protein product [Rotaria sp. Silwood2]CAF3927497.1 unnamed protein product [Rotaria sp. Silwood2]
MVLRVYFISTTGRRDIRKGQVHVFSVLSSWKFEYQAIDVAAPENENERNFVIDTGKKSENGKIVLPQIFQEENCCGDYLDFLNAIEDEKLQLFLKEITEQEFNAIKQKYQEEKTMNDETTKGKFILVGIKSENRRFDRIRIKINYLLLILI